MIDICTEHLIAIRDVPRALPSRGNGKPIHISAVYRWLLRGVRGVRLDSIIIGGTTYTSTEALQRFADQFSQGHALAPVPQTASTAQRRRQIEQAARRVAALLGQVALDVPCGTQSRRGGRSN